MNFLDQLLDLNHEHQEAIEQMKLEDDPFELLEWIHKTNDGYPQEVKINLPL